MLRDLGQNLVSGARLAFLLPTTRSDFKAGGEQAFLLLILFLATILSVELVSSRAALLPVTDRIGFYGLAILAGLGACLFALHVARAKGSFSSTAIMLLAGTLWIVLAASPVVIIAGSQKLGPSTTAGLTVAAIVACWFIVVAVRAMRRNATIGVGKAAALALILAGSVAGPKLILSDMTGWTMAAAKLPPQSLQENLYYGQFGMMNRAVDWLEKHRKGVSDLYFVGFGADAREGVFLNEMKSVARLFDDRFDTKGRSIVLLNNRQTVRQVPLANAHNLGRAVSEIGQRIDPEEDLLFLYLSAPILHNTEFMPVFDPLEFVPIHASNIRHMLDDAAIQWRIVFLSTCTGDDFIKRVQNTRSLVIAAAGRKSEGHGCTGNADYTYFGKVFFDYALQRGFSFPDAFEAASRALAVRERSEGKRLSKPEMHMGPEIAAKLEELTVRLHAAHAARTTVADRPAGQ